MVHRGGRRTAKGGKLEEYKNREQRDLGEEEVSSHSSVMFSRLNKTEMDQ